MADDTEPKAPRSGRCAIVGRPNVGKSTLLNALLRQKIVIATARPGTTRTNVLGVYSSEDPPTQIAFVDTPGMLRPRSELHRALVDEAERSLAEADVAVLLSEVGKSARPEPDERDTQILARIREAGVVVIAAVNKVDLLRDKAELLPLLEAWLAQDSVEAVVPVSARRGDNLRPLLDEIRLRLPEGLLYEDPDFLTDRSSRFFAAELVREAVLRHTRQEVPYGVAVMIDEWIDEPRLTRITASVIVEKSSHKGIVIGKGGSLLKQIGTEAREAMEAMLERKVFLKLWVKVEEGWTADAHHVRRLISGEETS